MTFSKEKKERKKERKKNVLQTETLLKVKKTPLNHYAKKTGVRQEIDLEKPGWNYDHQIY